MEHRTIFEKYRKPAGKILLRIGVSAFFIYLLLNKIDWQEALVYLKKIQVWQIGLYIGIMLIGTLISAQKWRLLCRYKNFHESLITYFTLYLTGAFINNFVPSTIGGDIFRAYQVGKRDKRFMEATSTVVADRFTGLLALMLMFPFFSLLNWGVTSKSPLLIWVNLIDLGLVFGFGVFVFFRKTAWAKKIVAWLPKKVGVFLRELNSFGKDTKIFFTSLAYSFLFNFIGVGIGNLVLFWSVGVPVNILDYLSVIFLISITSSIPAGIGFKEWSYITFFGVFGISLPGVLVVAVLNRFLQALVNVVALPVYWKNRKMI